MRFFWHFFVLMVITSSFGVFSGHAMAQSKSSEVTTLVVQADGKTQNVCPLGQNCLVKVVPVVSPADPNYVSLQSDGVVVELSPVGVRAGFLHAPHLDCGIAEYGFRLDVRRSPSSWFGISFEGNVGGAHCGKSDGEMFSFGGTANMVIQPGDNKRSRFSVGYRFAAMSTVKNGVPMQGHMADFGFEFTLVPGLALTIHGFVGSAATAFPSQEEEGAVGYSGPSGGATIGVAWRFEIVTKED